MKRIGVIAGTGLVPIIAAWIAGTFVALEIDPPLLAVILFALASWILTLLFLRLCNSPKLPVLLLVLMLSIIRVEATSPNDFGFGAGAPVMVEVRGVISDDPEGAGGAARFQVAVEEVKHEGTWKREDGLLLVVAGPPRELVSTRSNPFFRYGDRLELVGALQQPKALGDFDYGRYLANQGIQATMSFPEVQLLEAGQGSLFRESIYDVRRRMSKGIGQALPEP